MKQDQNPAVLQGVERTLIPGTLREIPPVGLPAGTKDPPGFEYPFFLSESEKRLLWFEHTWVERLSFFGIILVLILFSGYVAFLLSKILDALHL